MKVLSLLLLSILVSLVLSCVTAISPSAIADLYFNPATGAYTFNNKNTNGLVFHANIVVNFTMLETGWDLVEISPNRTLLAQDPKSAYYAMGYSEGYSTYKGISDMFFNHLSLWQSVYANEAFLKWFNDNIAFMNQIGQQHSAQDNNLQGAAAYRFMAQMQGIADGYNTAITVNNAGEKNVTFLDIFLMNAAAEFEDVLNAVAPVGVEGTSEEQASMRNLRQEIAKMQGGVRNTRITNGASQNGQHCSAFIKYVKNGNSSDLFLGHDTWNGFTGMLRQFKTMHWETTVMYSGSFTRINSGDDFYVTGNNLAVTETTLIQNNLTLTREFVKPNTMLYFLRIMTANVWTADGKTFMDEFMTLNSCTYCNQNQLLDMNLVNDTVLKSGKLTQGTFWMNEQLGGPYSRTADLTWLLNDVGFHSSFNIAWFPEVYRVSENEALCDRGSVFCNNTYARPLIFARNQSNVVDLASMQALMRYNGWSKTYNGPDAQPDPLSTIPNCVGCFPATNPMLAIASRGDQVPLPPNINYGNFSAHYGSINESLFGAIDTKITSYTMMMKNGNKLASSIVSGPTTSGGTIPVFDFRTAPQNITDQIRGLPLRFDFPFQTVSAKKHYGLTWKQYQQQQQHAVTTTTAPTTTDNGSNKDENSDNKKRGEVIGGAVAGGIVFIIIVGILLWRKKKTSGGDGAHEVQGGDYQQVV